MLDFKFIRAELDQVRKGASDKGVEIDLDRLIALDDQRKALLTEQEQLRHEQKNAGKEIATLDGDAKQQAIARMGEVSEQIKSLAEELRTVVTELDSIHARVPMPAASEVPVGPDESGNVELRVVGTAPEFDFEPKDHVELGQALDIVDFPRASKLAGSQTYILKGAGALLELAVLRFALDHVVERGFIPMIVPTMVKYEPLFGTAYFPGGEEQTYEIPRDDLYLTGTSEVPVTAFHSGEMLEEDQLPLRYCGWSTCYRREAGAAGKDTRGLYRIHQFNKVEQVIIGRSDVEESIQHHEFIRDNAEEILQAMEIPYRVVDVCTGDLGMGQVRKFDIEAWMPSRGWGETHSASRFYDYQARRMDLRYRGNDGKVHFCHTLNNTAIATPRVLIAILENHQRSDGTVRIPDVLVPYMGGKTEITSANAAGAR
ncbi:MAG: serine--tRNA ligase [Planctomycetota bacterium]|nr:serine--tRNA ligase [Planctomycetota bacterium]